MSEPVTEAQLVATQIVSWLQQSGAASELSGPHRLVTRPDGWSVVAVVNGVELWIDVRHPPNWRPNK